MTFLYPLSFSNIVLMSVLLIWLQSFSTGFANTTVRCENHPSSFSHTHGAALPLWLQPHINTRGTGIPHANPYFLAVNNSGCSTICKYNSSSNLSLTSLSDHGCTLDVPLACIQGSLSNQTEL